MQNKLLLIVVILAIILGSSMLTRGHDWGDDFAWYILQAKSVVEGSIDEFVETSVFTNTESTTYVGPTAYPWGYPLLLTPVYAIKGIHPLFLKLPAIFLYAGFLICMYLLAKVRFSKNESLLIVCLFAFNPMLLQFLDQILSDIPFLFFSTLSLWLIIKDQRRSTFHSILIGTSIFFVVFMRATGILLLGCFLIVAFFELLRERRNWPMAKQIVWEALLVCASFAVLFILSSLVFPGGGASYVAQYAGMSIDQIRDFAVRYFVIYRFFFGQATIGKYVYCGLVVFFLLGAIVEWKSRLIFILYFVFWMIAHIAYPYWQGVRYIFPLLPIFIYFTFAGMKFALAKLPVQYSSAGQWAFYGFWSLLTVYLLVTSTYIAYSNLQNNRDINGPFDSYSKEVYGYIRKETPAESIVVFFKPRVMRLMTDRASIMSMECDRILKGDYLVLSRKVGNNQQIPPEEIGACNLPLDQVLKNSRFIVYQIQK